LLSLAVERRNRRWRDNTRLARFERAGREALKKIGLAEKRLKQGNQDGFFSKIAEALRDYLADKMNAASAGLTFDAMDDFLAKGRVGADEAEELKRLLNTCDAAKYSAGSLPEGLGEDILAAADRMIKTFEKGRLGR